MFNEVIKYITNELAAFLGVDSTDLFSGNIHQLAENKQKSGVYLSIVNIEEEHTLKNTSHVVRKNNQVHYQEPPVYINLYLLIAVDYSNYQTSLQRLAQVVEFFQSRAVFDASHQSLGNPFPSSLTKLIFDFCNLNFEALNHLWAILGGAYLPSVLYKVRLVRIQYDQTSQGPEITTIQVDTNLQ